MIINGFPIAEEIIEKILSQYTAGIVTIEDGIIGNRTTGLRGFAGMISGYGVERKIPMEHIGIVDPRIAPSDGHSEVWTHFGLTKSALVTAIKSL